MRSLIVGAWFLFSLNGDGSLGPMMAVFSGEQACVNASLRVALVRGEETRCLGDYTLIDNPVEMTWHEAPVAW